MSTPFDGFGDVIEREVGIFAGSAGLGAYDSVRHSATQDGLNVEVHCAECGYPRHVLIAWPEIIALKYDVSPHEAYGQIQSLAQFASPWRQPSQQALQKGVKRAWMPANLRCRCNAEFNRPHMTAAECDQLVNQAVASGHIALPSAKQLSEHCYNVARQLGRRR